MTTETSYFVVSAPGYYGDETRVMSSHRTLAAAKRAAGKGHVVRYVVREGALTKGDVFRRAAEQIYPVAR